MGDNFAKRAAVPSPTRISFMRMSATGLPVRASGAPRLRITLVLGGEAHDDLSGITLPNGATLDATRPMWVNERIEIFKSDLERPQHVHAKVLCGMSEADELGVVHFELDY